MEGVQNSVTEELHQSGISAEDDSFLTSSSSPPYLNPQFSENHDFGLSDPGEAVRVSEDSRPIEELHQPSESSEPEKSRRSGKCNLRKSLAWNNAFFTNAGVLDAEELSTMIGGVDHGKHVLPGIQEEDLQRSMESISTLDSELTLESDLTLESLEADLFQDIRASIQKSSKAPVAANSNVAPRFREKGIQSVKSSNKVAPVFQNKATVKQPSSKLNIGSQVSGKEVKKSSVVPELTQKKLATKNSEGTSSIPKTPRPSGKVNLIPASPTKRTSLAGSNRVKTETSTAATRGAPLPKAPSSRNVVPRPTLPSKSTSMRRSSTTASTGPNTTTSLHSSTSTLSANVVKAQTISLKGNSNARVSIPLNSDQTPKTPSRMRLRNKSEHRNSHLSDYLRSSSTSKSSSMSASSSISEWSIESFSSASTVNQRSSNSKPSIDTSSPSRDQGSLGGDSKGKNMQKQNDQQILGGQKNLAARLSNQTINESLNGTGTLPLLAATKPSGLRMPSPKIGFFDGVKLQVRTPKAGHQPLSDSLRTASSCSPREGNNSKLKKFQSGEATIRVQGDELSRTLEAIDPNSGIK